MRCLLETLSSCLLVATFCGCGTSDDPATKTEPDKKLEAVCTDGTRWSAGNVVFVEATSQWGLDGVEGVRLAAVDFDGDGWTDLVVRRGGATPDDFGTQPACCATKDCAEGTQCTMRHTWLLRNTKTGFEDVTQSSGVVTPRQGDPALGRPGPLWAFADVDNDGDLDLYTGLSETKDAPQTETSEIMLNNGDGSFSLGPVDSALRVETGDVTAGAAFVDYDRDGLVDLWLPQNSYNNSPRQDHLYRGDGVGRFVDVTDSLGMTTKSWNALSDLNEGLAHSNAWSALACDLNGDGSAELLAASYGRAPNHLWQGGNAANGWQFLNRSVVSGYAFDHRVDWSDNESARCWCKLHPADDDCEGVPAPQYIKCSVDADAFRWNHQYDRQAFRLGGNSAATICGDVDNDGDMDLLTTEIVHWDVGSTSDPSELLFNDGQFETVFARPGNEATGLTREHDVVSWNDGDMSGALFDFDNDGWLDVYIGSSDYPGAKGLLYQNVDGSTFAAVPFTEGIDHNRSHGIAVADFDRDGDLDVVVGHSRSRCGGANDCYPTTQVRMFLNQFAQAGNWVQLGLTGGDFTNRSAIGARVTVSTADGVKRTHEIGGGHGHYGAQQDLVLHFGLGTACEADVTVRWPDGALTEQSFTVLSGYRFLVTQGQEPEAIVDPLAEPEEE